ncbi:MAG TPA: flagellar basal body rod protein FlgB [Methylomirabilota bacterium]|nr:flagellar basal body rod protein FlgB [Methylomirabilota bacterium]
MLTGIFDQANYAAAKRMLDATTLRHEAIASNLANVETPGYKRVDLDPSFQNSLAAALKAGDRNAISHVSPRVAHDSSAVTVNHDGNNVQLEKEMLALQQNAMSHAVEAQLITGSLLKLRLAITGRVG